MRELWNPAEVYFIRDWWVLSRGAEPAAGAPDQTGEWPKLRSWGDVADLGVLAGESGRVDRPRFAIAASEIWREAASDATISLFTDGAAIVWLNGELVGRIDAATGAVFPIATELPVRLAEGSNRLAVQLENRGGPWRLQAAVVEKGQEAPAPAQLIERFSVGDNSVGLTLRSRISGPAQVDVVGPGGRILDGREGKAQDSLSFDTASWPDGPYEIRVRARNAFGEPLISFHPWLKGDPSAILQSFQMVSRAAGEGAEPGRWRLIRELLGASGGNSEAIHSIAMEAAELRRGVEASVRPSGFVRLAWTDEVDGSDQFCRAYLPPDYDPQQRWPTIVNLHGFNPANPPYSGSWNVTRRHHAAADRYGVIWIEPHSRGNAQYIGIGERDVLRCLSEARRLLAIDAARTYLTGESMGGSGTWLIGSRHPSIFAAIAPVFGGWDFRLHAQGPFSNPTADRPMERWLAEAHSSFAGAEQLLNTPVFVQHGDADEAVDVEFSRHVVTRLQRWGYDVRYHEHPGRGHEDLGSLDVLVPWFLSHRLDPAPRRVRVRSIDLAGAQSAWLKADAAEAPLRMIEADAEVLAPGRLRIDTRNVGSMRVRLPPQLLSRDGSVEVAWNGVTTRRRMDSGGTIVLSSGKGGNGPVKDAELPGGLSHVFATPFIIVVGTIADDPAMAAQVRAKAEQLARTWQSWQHVRPRIVEDVRLSETEAASYSLVLLGGPRENSVARRLAASLPLTIGGDRIAIDGRSFPVRDAVVQMVRPSPLNPGRYVMVVGGTSAEGLWLWNASQFWRPVTGQPTNFYDWTIVDGRVPALQPGLSEERGWVASGVFDMRWRRTDPLTFVGDSGARAEAPLRRMTDRGLDLPPDLLGRLAGHYRLEGTPVLLEARERDGRLALIDPGGLSVPLLARSAEHFVTEDLRTAVTFEGQPEPCTLVLEASGERTVWRRTRPGGGLCTSAPEAK